MRDRHEMETELVNSMQHTTAEEILAVVDAVSELRRKYERHQKLIERFKDEIWKNTFFSKRKRKYLKT